MSETPPAGWYPDPQDAGRQRYWDGDAWTEHTADATPQATPQAAGTPARTSTIGGPDTWTWQSIIATILCCNILGVVGVLNAGRAEQAVRGGDMAAAELYASRAKKWTLWSAGVILVLGILYVLFFVVVIGVGGDFSGFEQL